MSEAVKCKKCWDTGIYDHYEVGGGGYKTEGESCDCQSQCPSKCSHCGGLCSVKGFYRPLVESKIHSHNCPAQRDARGMPMRVSWMEEVQVVVFDD